jgi:hypothetical protein
MKNLFGDSDETVEHHVPPKPPTQEEQLAMIWEAVFNGDGILRKLVDNNRWLSRHMRFQDVKLNFILIFLGLLLVCLGKVMFG